MALAALWVGLFFIPWDEAMAAEAPSAASCGAYRLAVLFGCVTGLVGGISAALILRHRSRIRPDDAAYGDTSIMGRQP